jgi:hypothetical protein
MTSPTPYEELPGAVERLRKDAIEAHLESKWQDNWAMRGRPMTADVKRITLEQWRPEAEREYADLPGLFRPFHEMPQPADFRELADVLSDSLGFLSGPHGRADFVRSGVVPPHPAYNQLTSVSDMIPDWAGIAAQTFRNTFAPNVEPVVWNEFSAIEGLRGPLLAAESLWTRARVDICQLVDKAQAAIDQNQESGGPVKQSSTLSLIGAVVGVLALPFTAGGSAPAVVAGFTVATSTIGLAANAAAVHQETKPTNVSIAGVTPSEIIDTLRSGLSTLNQGIASHEMTIAQHLGDLISRMAGVSRVQVGRPGAPDRGYTRNPDHEAGFTMPRPQLANVTSGNVTDDDYVGRPARL